MPQTNEVFFALVFFSALLAITVAFVLILANRNQTLAPKLLAICLFNAAIILLHTGLTFTTFYLHFPHMWRSMAWATMSFPVVSYLYVRSVLYQSYHLKKSDWLLVLPVVLFTICQIPYYLLPAAEKLSGIARFMADKRQMGKEAEGWIPPGWGFMTRFVFGLTLVISQYYLITKRRRYILQAQRSVHQNESILRWLFLFTSVLFSGYLALTVEYIFHFLPSHDLISLMILTLAGTVLFITGYLIVRPSILYGIQGWVMDSHPRFELPVVEQPEEKRPVITEEQARVFREQVENHMHSNKPYLTPGFKVKNLCGQLDIPAYQLSAFINQTYGKNFNEWVNGYRVMHIRDLLQSSPEFLNYTLEALMKEGGFNSRNTFFGAVKKISGQTPSEYFQLKQPL